MPAARTGSAYAAVGLALLSALPTAHASLYSKSSPVLQIDGKNYDRLIAKSNYTTALEFYAPWCGHCKNLQPAWEKAAKNLNGLANVAAVNCDEDANKPFCGQFGVQGFPTIKIVRPGKKYGKPVVDDYNGPRTAKDIVSAVVDKINNHVKRVTDADLGKWLSDKNETAKAILFSDKGVTGALLKSVAIDFLDVIPVAQIRNKEAKAVEMFGIEKFPTLVLLPGGDKSAVVYDGEIKKEDMVKFLSQAGEPNKPKAEQPKGAKKGKKSQAKKDSNSEERTATDQTEPAGTSTETPEAIKSAEVIPPIPALADEQLSISCLSSKSGTSILALVPKAHGEKAEKALLSLAEIAFKHAHGQRHLFPFYEVHSESASTAALAKTLALDDDVEIIAVNGKRAWWRHYEGDYSHESVEKWIDAIRLGEGAKTKLPEGVVVVSKQEKEETVKSAESVEVKIEKETVVEVPGETESPTAWSGADPTPERTEAEEPTASPEHDRDEL